MVSKIEVDTVVNQSGDQDSGLDLATNDNIKFKIANAEKAIIDANGNVGIGTTSPTGKLTVDGGSIHLGNDGEAVVFGSDTNTNNAIFGNATSNFVAIMTSGSERKRIDSSGNVLVGTTSTTPNPGIALSPNGYIGIGNSSGNSGNSFLEFRRSATQIGGVTQSGTTGVAFNTSSDYRLKENVVTDWDATTRLKQLKPSRFNFKIDKDTTVDGFLAHEVSSIVPEAITGEKDAVDKDGNPIHQGIDQSKLVPLLVKTIQELEARIVALESK